MTYYHARLFTRDFFCEHSFHCVFNCLRLNTVNITLLCINTNGFIMYNYHGQYRLVITCDRGDSPFIHGYNETHCVTSMT